MSGLSRFTEGSPRETRPWLTSFSIRYSLGAAVAISDGTGGTVGLGPGHAAKAASSLRTISARLKAPDTAATMLPGWNHFRWKATRSSRVIEDMDAAVAKRFVKWLSP